MPLVPAPRPALQPTGQAAPYFLMLELPVSGGIDAPAPALYCAIFARPWKGPFAISHSPSDSGFSQSAIIGEPATIGMLETGLPPGFEGRIDHATQIDVSLSIGELGSLDMLQFLAGGNALAIHSLNGEWEIVQFASADPLSAGRWRLGGLLRGQAGSGPAALARAPAGADVIVLDSALQKVELAAAQSGIELNWRATPAGTSADGANSAQTRITCHNLAARPLSPVHLATRQLGGGALQVNWVRRSRIDTGNWDNPDVPMDEPQERYLVTIVSAETVLRSAVSDEPMFIYGAGERMADLGSLDAQFEIRVAQVARTGLPGSHAALLLQP